MPKGALAGLAAATALYMALNRDRGIGFALGCVIFAALVPAVYMVARRLLRGVQRRETEQSLIRQTRAYLLSQESTEPLCAVSAPQSFRYAGFRRTASETAAKPFAGEPVVFDAIPAHPRAASFCLAMPVPEVVGLGELTPAVPAEFECWTAERHNLTIEYASAVLEDIRTAAVEGYQRMRHGGVEVGGILFGTHCDGVVRILAKRAIACEYAHGPRFILSEGDQAALAERLRACHQEIALQGLEPVGWYHSHTRSDVFLSEQDVAYFHRFFPQPWQVALVVRPANLAPVRAGFFFREGNGAIRTASSYREFQLAAPAGAAAAA